MCSLERIVTLLPWCSSVCPCGTGVHCDHMVHVSADLNLWLDSPMFWAPWHQSLSAYSQPSFSSSTWKRDGVWMCKLGVTSGEWLTYTVSSGTLNPTQLNLKRLSYYWVLIGSHICCVDWHNNGWPWVTLNGRFNIILIMLSFLFSEI